MESSDTIALAGLVIPTVFALLALWQSRGAKAAAAAAETRANNAEERAAAALALANRQAVAIEAMSATVVGAGPQSIDWGIERSGEHVFCLRNRGTETQYDVEIDREGRSGTVGVRYDAPKLERNATIDFSLADAPSSFRVTCRNEPEGRRVAVPQY
ncbi:hypothetical protein KXR83_25765 [Williamsia muralis]|uniref:hypothetical protein n=1 Tax=Williamsia marianensis TaxID=85044 RepID=UPI003F18701B